MKQKEILRYIIMFPGSTLWLVVWHLCLQETVSDVVALGIALAYMALKVICFLAYNTLTRGSAE